MKGMIRILFAGLVGSGLALLLIVGTAGAFALPDGGNGFSVQGFSTSPIPIFETGKYREGWASTNVQNTSKTWSVTVSGFVGQRSSGNNCSFSGNGQITGTNALRKGCWLPGLVNPGQTTYLNSTHSWANGSYYFSNTGSASYTW